ncbi:MAG: oxygen-independent coproporphyrinogen III oxidase [Oligoflexia bacterium]|nr:oxygen-independent coproporphyrinogen III oxidase [Oligoflexia bacterium]
MSPISQLLKKYDVPVPRYTSYPTVPYWESAPNTDQWLNALRHSIEKENSTWSLYLHIPFCETLCTYCGCNTSITKDHSKGAPYIQNLLKEWSIYRERLPILTKRKLQHVHLGGGTPTFLSGQELLSLLSPLLESAGWDPQSTQGSIEIDPRRTTKEQLQVLRKLNFQRVSLGVQDFNPEVQKLINRIQPEEVTKRITEQSRELGFSSVNFDLIYGLPKQTLKIFSETIESTLRLRPDRIALYSLALVPWIKPAQRLFSDDDLPNANEKRALYELARSAFLDNGYVEIGMDHFALKDEPLAIAQKENRLHRNFMGYTEFRTDLLLGLGVSSISETPTAFHQNEKVLPLWEQKIQNNEFATHRGHLLTKEDQEQREQILRFMTKGETTLSAQEETEAKDFLGAMIGDNLLQLEHGKMRITEKGRPFLRNACAFFDRRLRRAKPSTRIFSQSI